MVFHSSLYFTGVIWSITHFWQLSPLKYSINLKDKALKTIIIIIITLTLKNVSKYSFNTCIISVDIKHARCIYMVFIRVYCKLTTVQTKWVGGHLMMVVLSSSFFIFLTHEWVDNVMTLQHNTHGFITASLLSNLTISFSKQTFICECWQTAACGSQEKVMGWVASAS